MNPGLANAFSQSMGFDNQVNDLRYRQQMLRQQDAINESKRKLFESDIEYVEGGNAFDQPLVKQETQKRIQELGNYVSDNPDWETNFQKRGYVKQLKAAIKDNPTVLRALTTNDNRKALYQYAQESKNKAGMFDEDALQSELMRASNYERFGNPDGEEAAMKEGFKPYMFTRPQDFVDMQNVYKEAGASIKNPEIVETKYGGYYTKPKEMDVDARAANILQHHGNQLVKEFAKQGITDPKEIARIVKQNVIASFDSDFKLGDSLRAWELGMKQKEMNLKAKEAASKIGQGSYTPWHYFVDERNNPAGTIDKTTFDRVWGGVSPQYIKGNDGSKADLNGLDFKPTGRVINQGGRTFINGYVDMTPEIAKERGIYKSGFWNIDEVKPNFTGIAEEVTVQDKDGNDQKIIRVKYDMPINRDDKTAMQKFNIAVDVDKLVPQTRSPQEESFVDQGTYQGYKVGTVVNTDQGNFLVTPNGFKRQ